MSKDALGEPRVPLQPPPSPPQGPGKPKPSRSEHKADAPAGTGRRVGIWMPLLETDLTATRGRRGEQSDGLVGCGSRSTAIRVPYQSAWPGTQWGRWWASDPRGSGGRIRDPSRRSPPGVQPSSRSHRPMHRTRACCCRVRVIRFQPGYCIRIVEEETPLGKNAWMTAGSEIGHLPSGNRHMLG